MGRLSKETVKYLSKSPTCKKTGFSFGPFDIGVTHPDVIVGTLHTIRTKTIIQAFDSPILSVDVPEEEGAPFRLSATLCDRDGHEILIIEDNEWKASTGSWDIEVTGQLIVIRRALGDILLRLRVDPPKSITIEELNMYYNKAQIICRDGEPLTLISASGAIIRADSGVAKDCDIGIDIKESVISLARGGSLRFVGRM